MKIRSITCLMITFGSIILLATSCCKEAPFSLNSEAELQRLQTKIEKLADGSQIDSISIRSTYRNSLMSSVFLVFTDADSQNELKSALEFIPEKDLTMKEKSRVNKDALHSYKPNIAVVNKYIELAKSILPEGYTYKDVQSINYSASPFGEKYYFGLELNSSSTNTNNTNEYVVVYYDSQQSQLHLQDANIKPQNVSDIHHIIYFIVENNDVKMLKAKK